MKATEYVVDDPGDEPKYDANDPQDPARHDRAPCRPPDASFLEPRDKTSDRSDQTKRDHPHVRAIDVITKVGRRVLPGLFDQCDNAMEQCVFLFIFEM
jgi:hypothetical protein